MSQKEPKGPYVYQPEIGPTPFAVSGPGSERVASLRFNTKEEAHIVVELLHQVRQLQKIAAFVPGSIYIKAKETAGFGETVKPFDGR